MLLLAIPGCSSTETSSPTTAAPTTSTVPPTTTSTTTTRPPANTSTTTTTLPPTSVPPDVEETNPCLTRAEFGDPAESPYLLPFPPGERYQVSQSYCIQLGGHRDQLAYDFAMPIGRDVLAMRAGKVIAVKEDSPDDGWTEGSHNYVFILHADGSVAFYAHLRQDGVGVEVNDRVDAGEVIAESGNSGRTGGAHLHVQVFRRWPPNDQESLPINFRNATGPLDPRGGLRTDGVYEAPAG